MAEHHKASLIHRRAGFTSALTRQCAIDIGKDTASVCIPRHRNVMELLVENVVEMRCDRGEGQGNRVRRDSEQKCG